MSPWVAGDGRDELAAIVGHDLEKLGHEQSVGPFFCDVVFAAGPNVKVVVENQLTPSDHDHLGKLITYAGSVHASYAVWIAPEFTVEHLQAVRALNDVGGSSLGIFAIKINAISIHSNDQKSRIAPFLEVLCRPSPKFSGNASDSGDRPYWRLFSSLLEESGFLAKVNVVLAKPTWDWAVIRLQGVPQRQFHFSAGIFKTGTDKNSTEIRAQFVFGPESHNKWQELRALFEAQGASSLDGTHGWPRFYFARSANVTDENDWASQHEWLVERLSVLGDLYLESNGTAN